MPLKLQSLLAALILSLSSVHAADTWTPGAGWKLAWSDEFNGSQLARTNWTFDLGANGWGNNELERYTSSPTNIWLANGELVIQAVKSGASYSSARIKTQGLQSWTYGKIAARIKLPAGQGIWPAFWTLGNEVDSVGWPKCGEVDIMEMIGGGVHRDDTLYGTMHWQENGSHTSKGSGPKQLPNSEFLHLDYHVFEVEWSATNLIWKVDGVKYFNAPINPSTQPGTAAFQKSFFILLNLAVGGNWPGNPDATTVFPQQMRVDWVHVYQTSSTEEPKIEIKKEGKEQVIITWPSSGFDLENTPIFPALAWNSLGSVATNAFSVVAIDPAAFFRLRR